MLSLLIYNISLYLIRAGSIIHALFNSKTKKFIEGRKDVFEILKSKFDNNIDSVIWFHCSSLGEFEMSRPIIEKLKINNSGLKIVITFFSPSGYEVRKDYSEAFHVCYLPFDSKSNAVQFLDIVRPEKVFFAKYDLWYYYLTECKSRNIDLYLFNANFTSNQVFFKWYGGLFRKMLTYFDYIFVINFLSKKILTELAINNIEVAGDTRFDKVFQTVQDAKEINEIIAFKGNKELLVVGSSWKEDVDILFPHLNELDMKIIIAPHEIGESNLKYIENKISANFCRFSTINYESDILIIDNVGMLSSIYKYADYAYVGGAFRTGLHNVLEAATFGMPIFFGPEYAKFPDVIELIKREAVISVNTSGEFKNNFNKIVSSEVLKNEYAEKSRSFVMENVGGTSKILNLIN